MGQSIVDLVGEWADVGQSVTNEFLSVTEDPIGYYSDYTVSGDNAPITKSDPAKECGNLSLVSSLAAGTKEVETAVKGAAASMRQFVNSSMPLTWGHTVSFAFNGIQANITDYKAVIDSIVSYCSQILTKLDSPTRPVQNKKVNVFLDEVSAELTSASASNDKSYVLFKNHTYFDRDKWAESKNAINEAAKIVEENLDDIDSHEYF